MKVKTDWGSFGDKALEKAPADKKCPIFGGNSPTLEKNNQTGAYLVKKLHRKHLLVINNRILEKNPTVVLFGEKIRKTDKIHAVEIQKELDWGSFGNKIPV